MITLQKIVMGLIFGFSLASACAATSLPWFGTGPLSDASDRVVCCHDADCKDCKEYAEDRRSGVISCQFVKSGGLEGMLAGEKTFSVLLAARVSDAKPVFRFCNARLLDDFFNALERSGSGAVLKNEPELRVAWRSIGGVCGLFDYAMPQIVIFLSKIYGEKVSAYGAIDTLKLLYEDPRVQFLSSLVNERALSASSSSVEARVQMTTDCALMAIDVLAYNGYFGGPDGDLKNALEKIVSRVFMPWNLCSTS